MTVAQVAAGVLFLDAQQVVGSAVPLDAAQLPLSGARDEVTVRDSDVKVGETIRWCGEESLLAGSFKLTCSPQARL
ncbi:hypothetical protein ACFFLM_05760 [Deinococcus oregonensis]|uniref:Uncharacterized protein n=1 Tax=Deinococcus oregonensis TaxID=1805970 RepID=A0ABV6AVE0_9DEIO